MPKKISIIDCGIHGARAALTLALYNKFVLHAPLKRRAAIRGGVSTMFPSFGASRHELQEGETLKR
jgi:hypothetical protein